MMKRITFSIPWPLSLAETRGLLVFAFQTSLVSYLGFFLIESVRAGFVSSFFTLDSMIWIPFGLGIISNLWSMVVPEAKKEFVKPSVGEYLWMAFLTLGTIVVVWDKTSSLGWPAKIITPLSGLIVFGLSLLVYFNRDNNPEASP